MTEVSVPLGKKEDLHLELKGREVLQDLFKVGREVVGMLNAQGGEVWVGVREEAGRGVQVEPLADPELERQRLRDYLVDSIEPQPASEVTVDPVEWEGRPAVLRISVAPAEGRRPYALRRGTGRHFFVRFEDRLRPMGRAEMTQSLHGQQPGREEEERKAAGSLREDLDEAEQEVGKRQAELFWIGLKPLRRLRLETQEPVFEELLREPAASGNRSLGRHFIDPQWKPQLGQGWTGTRGDAPQRLRIHRDGLIAGWAALALLEAGEHLEARLRLERPVRALSPWALLEYIASAFRVAARAFGGSLTDGDRVLADLALLGIGEWVLGWGSPGRDTFSFEFRVFDSGDDFRLPDPEPFGWEEIRTAPDRCAFRLVRLVYEAFGFPDDAIPQEYDRRAQRLVLPE